MKKNVYTLALAIFGLGLCLHLNAAPKKIDASGKKNKSYSIVILGDTHFDASPDSIYHTGYSDPNPKREASHRKEFVRNANMWSERIPRLLSRASALIDGSTKMVFQTGDLIQGDTGCAEDHKKMLGDATERITSALGTSLPFITPAGNHDIRSFNDKISRQAYEEFICDRMTATLGKPVTKSTFAFNIGPDAYIVIDFTRPDDKEIERLMEETEGARYTFLLIHSPVFPYDDVDYGNWYLHGKDKDPQARLHLRQLFAKRDVIVLCGHSHATEFLDWQGDGGRITQMTMSSVWAKAKDGQYTVLKEGAEQYGTINHNPELYDDVRAGITRYKFSYSDGCYRLNVSPKKVSIDFYAGDSSERSDEFVLRERR